MIRTGRQSFSLVLYVIWIIVVPASRNSIVGREEIEKIWAIDDDQSREQKAG